MLYIIEICLLITILYVGAPVALNHSSNITFKPVTNASNSQISSWVFSVSMPKKQKNEVYLERHYFRNKNITCNDGTTAGYYLRESKQSEDWIIFLEGGWYCFSEQSCSARMNSYMVNIMTSRNWPPTRAGSGILSSNADINPTWENANHVLVPYCSSDSWSGNVSRLESGGNFSFMGYRIVNEVIKELLPTGLKSSKQILLTGSSAGAIGVMMHIDRVADMMMNAGSSAVVRGLSDSGWYIDRKICTQKPIKCRKLSDVIAVGMRYWRGVVPRKCAAKFPNQKWKCYFGHNIYRTLTSPLFVFQWQYDQTQLIIENFATGLTSQSNYFDKLSRVLQLANDTRVSFEQNGVNNIFSPACISHTVITNNNWRTMKVKGHSLDWAINCWISRNKQNHSSSGNVSSNECKFIDECSWPQCNPLCPFVRKMRTGEPIGGPKSRISIKPNNNQLPN